MIKSNINFENFAFWSLLIGTALSALGPVFHYSGWTLALFALAYGKIRYGKKIMIAAAGSSRIILFFILLYFCWSFIANALSAESFFSWGKSASIPLEMLVGIMIAMSITNSPLKIKKFSDAFIKISAILMTLLIYFESMRIQCPFHGLINQNTVGLYSIIILPLFFCYSLWLSNSIIYKYIACLLSVSLTFFSFSTGPWIVALLELSIIFYCAAKNNLLSKKFVIVIFSSLFVISLFLNIISGNKILPRFKSEMHQVTAIENPTKLTSSRKEIWESVIYMIKERPFTGYGRASYTKEFYDHLDIFIEKGFCTKENYNNSHPHSMYLGTIFDAGIPSLALILIIFLLLLRRAYKIIFAKQNKPETLAWSVLTFSLISGLLVYGLVGDVLESRNDLSPILWCFLGTFLALQPGEKDEID